MSQLALYTNDIRAAISKIKSKKPTLILISGESAFLREKSQQIIKVAWSKISDHQATFWQGDKFEEENFSLLYEQTSLFESSRLHFIRRFNKQADLSRWIKGKSSNLTNCIAIEIGNYKINKKLEECAKKIDATFIRCPTTTQKDYPVIFSQLASQRKLKFETGAANLISQVLGYELFALENELNRLSLSVVNGSVITLDQLRNFLSIPSNENIFELTKYILQRKNKLAINFVHKLVSKGESILAINGIISRHCRTALIINKQNDTALASPPHQKLPYSVIKSYNKYTKSISTKKLQEALLLCQKIDLSTKSENQDSSLGFYQIVDLIT